MVFRSGVGVGVLAVTLAAFPLALGWMGVMGALSVLALGFTAGAGLLVLEDAGARSVPGVRGRGAASRETGLSQLLKALPSFLLLLAVRTLSRLLFRFDAEWLGRKEGDPWKDVRVIAILNHTSLYEPIFSALVPLPTLWRLARGGVVPVASKTMSRPGVGLLFRFVSGRVVPVSRKRDGTWGAVLEHFRDPSTVAVICPEGRMLRKNGLDADGRPMTVKSGVADLLANVPGGRMLLVYSGGLHHVAAPGDRVPRLFRRVPVRLEVVDVAEYRASMGGVEDLNEFRREVVHDLTRRRNRHCPLQGPTQPRWTD